MLSLRTYAPPRAVRVFLCLVIFLISIPSLRAQNGSSFWTPSDSLNKKRLRGLLIAEGAVYGVTMIGLNQLWYADYPRSSFHFFNDNKEWLQMDKMGHMTTGYYVGRLGIKAMQWTGAGPRKQLWLGGSLGFMFLTTIEILDGFSSEWGASWGDLVANGTGAGLVMAQHACWQEQRITPKFSFHRSMYAEYRPDLLGHGLNEELLKDYNGQTYWLSVSPRSFLGKDRVTWWPGWLNVALGYGADGMTGGSENHPITQGQGVYVTPERYRQFYFSLDVDLTRIETRSKALGFLFNTFGFIKFPAPALELNRLDGWRFHPVYF
ncbi:MAG: DUF2279 domain-containing protein [Flavobacteriales bacterium]|nr:DUF2279 domain-containing protein [Flavobacteriales bacterium]